ncbi:MAG TPA: hypothetical protein VFB59_00655 [Candidatus Saccharimonadales bacterium]|nr:hypothetical protein [Candidatus Saccharimonadales bacterium]
MINLLPPEIKQNYHYARRNFRLLFWGFAFVGVSAGVFILMGFGLLAMSRSIDNNKAAISELDKRLASQDLAGTQREVTTISNNLKLMVDVLSKEILFSQLLVRLGNTMPSGVVLAGLSISETEKAIDVTARSTNYAGATQLQANLADPGNNIFSKADIVTITCSSTEASGIAAAYPCAITIRALFAENNPFLFINADKAAQ